MPPTVTKTVAAVRLGVLRYPLSVVGKINLDCLTDDPSLLDELRSAAQKAGRACDIDFLYRFSPEYLCHKLGVSWRVVKKIHFIRLALGIESNFPGEISPEDWTGEEKRELQKRLARIGAEQDTPSGVRLAEPTSPAISVQASSPHKQAAQTRIKKSVLKTVHPFSSLGIGRSLTERAQRRAKRLQAKNSLVQIKQIGELLSTGQAASVEEAAQKLGLSNTRAYLLVNLDRRLHPDLKPLLDPATSDERWLSESGAKIISLLDQPIQKMAVEKTLAAGRPLTSGNLRRAIEEIEKLNGQSSVKIPTGEYPGRPLTEILEQLERHSRSLANLPIVAMIQKEGLSSIGVCQTLTELIARLTFVLQELDK